MKCALVVGHTPTSRGAWNQDHDITEFDFNSDMVKRMPAITPGGVDLLPVYRNTYRNLPYDINALEPDFILSLHCNAYDRTVEGCETLYYHSSINGKRLAREVQPRVAAALGNPDRGIKPKGTEDRGGYLLRYTVAPCVIVEPFFIDSNDDLANALEKKADLINAYIEAIDAFAGAN